MRQRLILAFVSFTLVILVVFGLPLRGFVQDVERERLLATLERDAFILAGHAQETLNLASGESVLSVQPFLEEHDVRTGSRVIITNAAGVVVASNDPSLTIGTEFSNRPEIQRALTGAPAVGERSSRTLGEALVFVAVPVLDSDTVLGVVRFSNPRSVIDDRVRNSLLGIAAAGLFTVLAGVAVAIPVSLGLVRPIRRLTRHTDQLAKGDLSQLATTGEGPKEIRDLSRAYNTMAVRLNAMMESQRQFNGVVSHQLRTPLTALRLRLEYLAERGTGQSQEFLEALEASHDEVDRLQEIVEQMLKLSRLESGLVPIETVEVNEVLATRIDMWQPLADERNINLVVQCPPLVRCLAIGGGLEQILDNYIDNALGVSNDGDTIGISVTRVDDKVIIEVSDHGPGLDDTQKNQAFQRFWRKPGNQNTAGTGLGLAIVHQIAQASGAQAYFKDRDDGKNGLVAVVACATT